MNCYGSPSVKPDGAPAHLHLLFQNGGNNEAAWKGCWTVSGGFDRKRNYREGGKYTPAIGRTSLVKNPLPTAGSTVA